MPGRCCAGCIDLIYIDPPFGTGQVRNLATIRTGSGERTRSGFGGRTYRLAVTGVHAYRNDMPLAACLEFLEFLEFLGARLAEAHRVLRPTGSPYLHLGHHAVHHGRLLLDAVFGPEHFLNEIIWAYDCGCRPRDRWPTTGCGIPARIGGHSIGRTSTASPPWPPGWSGPKRRPAASCRRMAGG